MFFNEKLYVPGDFNDEVFLTDFPIEIIENSVSAQFKDPFEFRNRDYLQTFFSQYDYSINNCNEDESEKLEEFHDIFIQFLLNIFNEKLGIGLPNIEDKIDVEVHEMIHIIYRFFIMNIKRNFSNYIYNYIYSYQEQLSDLFGGEKRKDVTTNSFREDLLDAYDTIILVNLPRVINHIIYNIHPADKFLEMCNDDTPCLETTYVSEKFSEFEITGNFTDMYVHMLSEDAISDISSDIRSRILKKYPSRFAVLRNEELQDENDDSNLSDELVDDE